MNAAGGFLSLAAAAMLMIGCSDSDPSIAGPSNNTNPIVQPLPEELPGDELYRSLLSGANEVPPVATLAAGSASFHETSDTSAMVYAITLTNIVGVIDARIHVGDPESDGLSVVDLFDGQRSGEYNGLLLQAKLTPANFVGELAGKSMSEFHALIRTGRAYLNVYTLAHPYGELRGPIAVVVEEEEVDNP